MDFLKDAPSPGVVRVDDHFPGMAALAGGKHFGEEPFLGLEVVFHRNMVVEVVLGEVGEDPQIERTVVDSPQGDGVGGDLGDDVGDAVVRHLPKDPLQFKGLGRGVRRREGFVPISVVHGSQNADGEPRSLEDCFKEVGSGRLAVGPNDADEADPGRGISEEVFPQEAQGAAAVGDANGGYAGRRKELALMNEETGAAGKGVGDERMAVRLGARNRREEIPFGATAGIVANRSDFTIRIAGDSYDFDPSEQLRQLHWRSS